MGASTRNCVILYYSLQHDFAIFIMFILDFLKLVNFKAFKMSISLEKVFTTKKKGLKVL